ncbi:MAG: sugar phosphate isomerase/epimerase [Lentisphaerae bacterium]|jgi:sugar phosphate isomerase/epimerase|nr:sugar phosphate isomerase/epimerase [Lentisphaerota bacterium]
MAIRLGCNTLYPFGRLNDVREQFDLVAQKRALRTIRDTGFDGCEFSHYECLTRLECETLRQECERIGLTPWSAHSWVALPASRDGVDERLQVLHASVADAAALGAQVMVIHAARPGADGDSAALVREREETLRTVLTEMAGSPSGSSLRIAVENCGDRAEVAFLAEVISSLSLANVGMNIDTGHAVLHGMAPAETIRMMGKLLFTTHFQDNHNEGKDEHLPPGQGTIDWDGTISALDEVGYQGMWMVEISDCPPGREPDAAADTAAAYRFLAGKAGR